MSNRACRVRCTTKGRVPAIPHRTRIVACSSLGLTREPTGYDLLEAESIDEAAAFMAKHPTAHAGRVLILPVVPLPWEDRG